MFEVLLGHAVGDYLLQNDWMALNKTRKDQYGYFACAVHSFIYSCSVCLFMWQWSGGLFLIIFLSHFFIDKFSLGEVYCHHIKGSGLKNFIGDPNNKEYSPSIAIKAGFSSFVYIVVDNTLHLVLMVIGLKLTGIV